MRMIILLNESDRKNKLSHNVMDGLMVGTKERIAEAHLVGFETPEGDVQLIKYRNGSTTDEDGEIKRVSFKEFTQMAFFE